MSDFLYVLYPWVKSLHIMAVLSWMAGLFYLPRLFVYHVERAGAVAGAEEIFETMEHKLLRFIMAPAMIVAWVCGLIMVVIPGIVDWTMIWPWTKAAGVVAMTWFHFWLGSRRKDFQAGRNSLTGRQFRLMNEVPTLLMVIIVVSVIVKF
ncbi:CopD family protein [Cribrihabitans sp. XS_ASV171]